MFIYEEKIVDISTKNYDQSMKYFVCFLFFLSFATAINTGHTFVESELKLAKKDLLTTKQLTPEPEPGVFCSDTIEIIIKKKL